ncbi:LPXTG cell wall anchor domain-containing protein [Lactiplantibacillus nangangensis]|uniref:LPXTG cell wall anchor domain-containing protein n=1 Tax=Lactiplantibacillus nangangensis TaxID=2559917 RepID=A0ABW1SMV0_9LACO|nr:LPXTG cell wall anchor domain-containing protein [Lactiplantibacillus nangangensis]
MKGWIVKVGVGLALLGCFAISGQAATTGQTSGQVKFYQSSTTTINRQSIMVNRLIPDGEIAIPATISAKAAANPASATVSQLSGWLQPTQSSLRLPQTDEAQTTYWLILGGMLLLVAGLLKLIQQTKNGEATKHVAH